MTQSNLPVSSGAPAEDLKKVGGEQKKRTVVQLHPVSYQIFLYYLGHDRVSRDATNYRCKYKLKKEDGPSVGTVDAARADPGATLVNAPAVIANILPEADPKADTSKPALPAAQKGDSSNPNPDEIYRIVVVDNHAVAKADLNAVFGGALSKPDSYNTRGWMPEVQPVVPFRVVVKKFIGDVQADVAEDLEVLLEVKDPREEFDQTDGPRLTFIKGFFKKYNGKTGGADTTGNDNALKTFAGLREPAKTACVKASGVFKGLPYTKPPIAGEVAAPDKAKWADLKVLEELGTRAKLKLENVPGLPGENKRKIAVADFAFLPAPVNGDNYRILLSLRGMVEKGVTENKELQTQKVNGAPVKVYDAARKEIKVPCAYTTGRFVMWREIEFRLIVLCNGVSDVIDWDTWIAWYRKSFIEVIKPRAEFTITWQVWRDAIKLRYNPSGAGDNFFTNDVAMQAAFTTGLIPGRLKAGTTNKVDLDPASQKFYNFNLDRDVHFLTRELIKHACVNSAPAITNPDDNDQKDSDGLFVLFARHPANDLHDGTLGEYMGDRIFYMYHGDIPQLTNTGAHEMGHTLFLSHSLTNRSTAITYEDSSATSTNLILVDPKSNCAFEDHDGNDNYTCIMGYIRHALKNYGTHFCGFCSLGLRFYKKTELQKSTEYGNQITEGSKVAHIVQLSGGSTLKETVTGIANNAETNLLAVTQPKTINVVGGGTWTACINLSRSGTWSKEAVSGGDVTITPQGVVATVKGTAVGRVRVKFALDGTEASVEFNVT
ncbi:MAG: hypothetical protein ABSH20_14280 [Tepidisphaeraceae bacterium]